MENRESLQRFKRTRNEYSSPQHQRKEASPRMNRLQSRLECTSLCSSEKESFEMKSMSVNSELSEDFLSPSVENRIAKLQKMLDNEKQRRQTEYAQLLTVISSLNEVELHEPRTEKMIPNFLYGELEFPMTPRMSETNIGECEIKKLKKSATKETIRINNQITSRIQDNLINYHKTDNKTEPNKNEKLIQNIYNQTEKNTGKIEKLEASLISLISNIESNNERNLKEKQFNKINLTIEIEKLINQECLLLKNNLNIFITEKFNEKTSEQKGKEKEKELIIYNNITNEIEKINNKIEIEYDNLNEHIKNISINFEEQIEHIEHNHQQKLNILENNVIDQINKEINSYDQIITTIIEKEKERIDQIEEENKIIFEAFEKTIENLQDKLQYCKNGNNYVEEEKRDIIEIIRKEKEIIYTHLNNQINLTFEQNQHYITEQINYLNIKMEKLEANKNIMPSFSKLIKQTSLTTQNESSLSKEHQSIEDSQVLSYSYDSPANLKIDFEEKPLTKKQNLEIRQIINEKYSSLENNQHALKESITEIVQVLNGVMSELNKFN